MSKNNLLKKEISELSAKLNKISNLNNEIKYKSDFVIKIISILPVIFI